MRYKYKTNGVIAGKEIDESLNILLENTLKLAFL